jgi:hypothetical protein
MSWGSHVQRDYMEGESKEVMCRGGPKSTWEWREEERENPTPQLSLAFLVEMRH